MTFLESQLYDFAWLNVLTLEDRLCLRLVDLGSGYIGSFCALCLILAYMFHRLDLYAASFGFCHCLSPSLPPSLPPSTDGLTTPTQSALIPQPVGSAPRLGNMSTNSRIIVEWNPAPPLSFSSPIVYRLEYSLMHMNGSRMPTEAAIVSNLIMVISFTSKPLKVSSLVE